MSPTPSKHGRRFEQKFKREPAALAGRPGAKPEQAARGLWAPAPASVSRWKKLYGAADPRPLQPAGVDVAQLERRLEALARENAHRREQGTGGDP